MFLQSINTLLQILGSAACQLPRGAQSIDCELGSADFLADLEGATVGIPPTPTAAAGGAVSLFLAGGSAVAAAAFLLFSAIGGYVTRWEGTC